ncbi:alpha/beta hydrolase [Streptomyces sp. TRM70308]|uniref:alpha/beta hydrolase n=1 Tax=Streptomyces sp. TRM70308 TaxID=3131932 RepID=UPI003D033588
MVFVLLTTTGWTARQDGEQDPDARTEALLAWEDATLGGRGLPSAEAGAAELARFFGTLDPRQRRALTRRHPLVVGNLDGVPVRLRYQANRIALRRAAAAEAERHADPRLSPVGRHLAGRRMNRFTSLLEDGRQILAFDPTGGGRVAEVFGDLRRAERVSVVVPGADVDVLTFERTRMKYAAPVGMAQAVRAEQRRTAPGVRTATIAWADYTAPRGASVDAATGELAQAGARRLTELVAGLPGAGRVALLCHSYGSVVCGLAARDPDIAARVTDVAVAGSPGMRAGSAEDLAPGVAVWAMRTPDDWIADVPYLSLGDLGHGADPVSPAFGARRLATGSATGHTGYFTPGTESLANLAAIGSGAYGSAELH